MNRFLIFLSLFCIQLFILASATSQDLPAKNELPDIIQSVKKAQESLKTVSYTLERTDSLVSGDTRTMAGRVMIKVDKGDGIFGFEFQARKDGIKGESIYDGRMVYETSDDQKTYSLISSPSQIPNALWEYGGQIIFTDLIRLDTSGVINFTSWEDVRFIYLRLNYADLTEYNVTNRSKTLTIDKTTLLPMAVRKHQESLGRIQDLYYHITEIHVNDPAFNYDFSSPDFLKGYSQRIAAPGQPLLALKERQAPHFSLSSFDHETVSSDKFRGKLLLLDFWEIWCGPCVESMPKIQHLYDAYKNKGLQVYGIINDSAQLEPSRLMVRQKGYSFPMLIGNGQLKKDYELSGIPLYVLIDRNRKVCFVSQGYSDELEAAIKSALTPRRAP